MTQDGSCSTAEQAPRPGGLSKQAGFHDITKECHVTILKAHNLARRRRLRISGVSVAIGFVGAITGMIILLGRLAPPFGAVSMIIGMHFIAQAILPTDRRAIFAALAFGTFMCAVGTGWAIRAALFEPSQSIATYPAPCFNSTQPSTVRSYCIVENIQYYIDIAVFFVASVVGLWSMRLVRDASGRYRQALFPRMALERLWTMSWYVYFVSGFNWIANCIARSLVDSTDPTARNHETSSERRSAYAVAATFLIAGVMSTSSVRKALQSFLAGTGTQAEARQRAASIAAVIGAPRRRSSIVQTMSQIANPKQDAIETIDLALAVATRNFRAISFGALAASHFESSDSSTDLPPLTKIVRLGEIDFFMSHSWHDDPAAKWASLCEHAEAFRQEYGRDPLLWLDKACLDQTNIAAALSQLPVHLAGCNRLLVVAGSTYASRIWVLLELYVWVAMGKPGSSIDLLVIEDGIDCSSSTSAAVRCSFRNASITKAQCSSEGDRNKILGIIEASFTSLGAFDRHLRRLLLDAEQATRRRLNHQRSSAEQENDPSSSFTRASKVKSWVRTRANAALSRMLDGLRSVANLSMSTTREAIKHASAASQIHSFSSEEVSRPVVATV